MKAPFFLLGFLSMFIGVSAFAEVQTELVPYEQKVRNLVEGMELTFKKDTLLIANRRGDATITGNSFFGNCTIAIASNVDIRMEKSLKWTVISNSSTFLSWVTLTLRDPSGRTMTIRCGEKTPLEVLRDLGIEVPRERPVQVDVINGSSDDALVDRNESAAVTF